MGEMRIDLTLGNVGGVGAGLSAVLNFYGKIARAQERVIANAARVNAVQSQVMPSSGLGGSAGRGVGAASRSTAGVVSGPMARYLKAREQLSRALNRGTTAEIFDAQNAVDQSRAAVDKARNRLNSSGAAPKISSSSGPFAALLAARKGLFETLQSGDTAAIADAQLRYLRATQQAQRGVKALTPSSFSDRLGDVLKTSRISLGGGGGSLSPLVGKLAGLAGGSGGGPDPLQFLAARGRTGARLALPGLGGAARPGGLMGGLGSLVGGAGRGIAGAVGGMGGMGAVASGAIGALGGIAAAAGPVGIALGIATAAAHVFSAGLSQAVGAVNSFRDAMRQSGGTAGEVSQLTAFGLDPKEIASTAAAFREATSIGSGDVMGQIGRARLGMGPSGPRGFGQVNEAGDLVKAIEGLRKIENPAERLQVARMTKTEGLLKIADMPESPFRAMMKDAEATQSIQGDPKAGVAAAEMDANMGRVGRNAGLLVTSLFKPFVEPFSAWLGMLADTLRKGAEIWNNGPGKMLSGMGHFTAMLYKTFGRIAEVVGRLPIVKAIGKFIGDVFGWIGKAFEGLGNILPDVVIAVARTAEGLGGLIDALNGTQGNPFKAFTDDLIKEMEMLKAEQSGDLKRALDRNTDATNGLTGAMKTAGGGARARAAATPLFMQAATPMERRRWLEEQVRGLGFWGQ